VSIHASNERVDAYPKGVTIQLAFTILATEWIFLPLEQWHSEAEKVANSYLLRVKLQKQMYWYIAKGDFRSSLMTCGALALLSSI
jgi:hypothetical protein